MTIEDLSTLARQYAAARGIVAERVAALQSELDIIRRRRLPGIRVAVGGTRDAQSELERAITAAPHLFAAPRTLTLHGIRLGYRKGTGKVAWDDEARVVALIERHYPGRVEELVKTTRKPIRRALAELAAADLKRLGCSVTDAGDLVFVKAADTEVDKLVAALLDEPAPDAE